MDHGMMDDEMSDVMDTCIEECLSCHANCLDTITHCLLMGGDHALPEHITLLQDCAQICQTSADFMLRDSDLHGFTCGVCAEICERCAEDCAQFDNDELMHGCAETCTSCAQTCREMERMAPVSLCKKTE
jgi:hypothetical protein